MAVRENVPNPLIHRVELNPKGDNPEPQTELEKILKQRERTAALRFSAAELDKMALEAEGEASRLRKYPDREGVAMANEEELTKMRQQIAANAVNLLNNGVDPKIVGQFLLGGTQTIPISLGGGGGAPVTQGFTFAEVMQVVDRVTQSKEKSDLETTERRLEKKIEEVAKGGGGGGGKTEPQDPIAIAQRAAEITKATYDAWVKMGLISVPEPKTGDGRQTIEELRESHRHKEKMEEIKADGDYKKSITGIAADIPGRIGRSIATQMREESGGTRAAHEPQLERLICDDCGETIIVTPTTGNTVTCNCGSVYRRGVVEE